MKLSITGIGRIAEAKLDLNGITVLVGDNNTGKTTVGKVLYAFFNSFVDIERRIFAMRKLRCRRVLEEFRFGFNDAHDEILIEAFLKKKDDAEKLLMTALERAVRFSPFFKDVRDIKREFLDNLIGKLRIIRDMDDHEIINQITTNTFLQVFADDYMPARPRTDACSSVCLSIRGTDYKLNFRETGVLFDTSPYLEHDAYFIDSPDLIEDLDRHSAEGRLGAELTRKIAKNMQPKDDPGASAIDDLLANKRMERILGRINSVIHGKLSNESNGRVGYADAEMGASFRLKNISRGVRAFALLEAAIRHHAIVDQDVLILDEPEIHLHPEWLMDYAELLVILQEEMELTLLVTTHSAYFLQALQLYAKKHGRSKALNAYQAVRADDGNVEILKELPSDNWDQAYLSFLKAANKLRQLRDEVNGDAAEERS